MSDQDTVDLVNLILNSTLFSLSLILDIVILIRIRFKLDAAMLTVMALFLL